MFPALTLPYRVVDGLFLDGGSQFLTVMEIEPARPAGRQVAVHSELRVWSAQDGKPAGEPVPLPLANVRVELNAAGDRLLIRGDQAGQDRGRSAHECQLRDVKTLKNAILPRGDEFLREARFSPDGRLVAAVAAVEIAGKAPTNNRSRRRTPPPGSWVAPDGRLLTIAPGPVVHFYRASDGTALPATLNHEAPIERIAFAPDGTAVITSGADLVRMWNVTSGQPLAPVLQGQSFIEFSFDSRLMLMKSSLGAPQVWWRDPYHGRIVAASPPLPAAAWSPTIRPEKSVGLAPSTRIEAKFVRRSQQVAITSHNFLENLIETRTWAIGPVEVTEPTVRAADQTNVVGLVTDARPVAGPTIKPGQVVGPSPGARTMAMLISRTVLAPNGKTFAPTAVSDF